MANVAPGVELRGNGLRIYFKHKGVRYQETDPGPGDAAHIRRAIKRREWLLSRLRVGLPIYEDDDRLLRSLTSDYFESLDVKRSTLMSYRALYEKHWKQWETLSPDVITTGMIRNYLNSTELSVKTKKNALVVLSGILSFGELNPNPCAPIRFKKKQKEPVERYLPDELEAIMKFLDGEKLVYFQLLRATGLRPGEAMALEWTDYDGEHLVISKQIVRRRLVNSTKTSVRRRVYVPTWVRPILAGHYTMFKRSYIFLNELGEFHKDTDDFNQAWKRAHSRARKAYRIPYTLRHTRAAELLSQGVSPGLAAKQLGHSVQMFLNVYSEYLEEYAQEDHSLLEGTQKATRKDVESLK